MFIHLLGRTASRRPCASRRVSTAAQAPQTPPCMHTPAHAPLAQTVDNVLYLSHLWVERYSACSHNMLYLSFLSPLRATLLGCHEPPSGATCMQRSWDPDATGAVHAFGFQVDPTWVPLHCEGFQREFNRGLAQAKPAKAHLRISFLCTLASSLRVF